MSDPNPQALPPNIFDRLAADLRATAARFDASQPNIAAGLRDQADNAQRTADQIRAERAAAEGRD